MTSKPRIFIVGNLGMLGQDCTEVLSENYQTTGGDFIAADNNPIIDIRDSESCQSVLNDFEPDIVVNCAAYTMVDACENHEAEAYAVNAEGVENLARTCRELNAYLIHISTDYVFDGETDTPYTEEAVVNPQCVYGASKWAGEQKLRENNDYSLTIRTSGLFGIHGHCFPRTILKHLTAGKVLNVVNDQTTVPTHTFDLAKAIHILIPIKPIGILNVVAKGYCTWYEFARKIAEESGLPLTQIQPTTTANYPTPARRPKYSVLSTSKYYHLTQKKLPSWQEGLTTYLIRMKEKKSK